MLLWLCQGLFDAAMHVVKKSIQVRNEKRLPLGFKLQGITIWVEKHIYISTLLPRDVWRDEMYREILMSSEFKEVKVEDKKWNEKEYALHVY